MKLDNNGCRKCMHVVIKFFLIDHVKLGNFFFL